jgi:hypothetical protein
MRESVKKFQLFFSFSSAKAGTKRTQKVFPLNTRVENQVLKIFNSILKRSGEERKKRKRKVVGSVLKERKA